MPKRNNKKIDYSSLSPQERYDRALEDAAQQLSYRPLSQQALRDKLTGKGHGGDEADYAVAWLLERGYLSDERLAESAVQSYTRRGYGSLRIRQELRRKGIGEETAQAVLDDCEPDMEVMHKLIDKRLHGDLSDRREVGKTVAALQRRGYKWEEIRRALNTYGADIEADFD